MIVDPLVHAVMSHTVRTLPRDATLADAARMFRDGGFHHAPVLDGDRVVGIVSAIDVARASLDRWVGDPATRDAWLETVPVGEAMAPLPEVLRPRDPLKRAAEQLAEGAFHALPVVDPDAGLVGILTTTDLARFLAERLR